jgi:peroxiredoxin
MSKINLTIVFMFAVVVGRTMQNVWAGYSEQHDITDKFSITIKHADEAVTTNSFEFVAEITNVTGTAITATTYAGKFPFLVKGTGPDGRYLRLLNQIPTSTRDMERVPFNFAAHETKAYSVVLTEYEDAGKVKKFTPGEYRIVAKLILISNVQGQHKFADLYSNFLSITVGQKESPTRAVKTGQLAPEFDVTDANDRVWKLSDLKGKKSVLLTFFPKCFTGGCANHLSSLRDHQAEFDKNNVQIFAVSVDPAEGERGQKAFAAQWHFLFPLIPDTQRTLCKLYGAVQQNDERAARMTFLIDKQGIVRFIDTDVHVQTHGADMLAKLRKLKIIP